MEKNHINKYEFYSLQKLPTHNFFFISYGILKESFIESCLLAIMIKGIQKIFSEVADTYEITNHILTFGLDIHWRRKAAKEAAKAGGNYWLDVCSGTGEMADNLSRLADEKTKIISADFSSVMLAKAIEKRKKANIFFLEAEAKRLPFPDKTFDLVTLSFATRNIDSHRQFLLTHLREFHRILKPAGCFVNLETSQPRLKFLRKIFHLYIRLSVKPIGSFLSGSKRGYSYLSFTIPRFYSSEDFSSLLYQSGFRHVRCHEQLFGISAIHVATK